MATHDVGSQAPEIETVKEQWAQAQPVDDQDRDRAVEAWKQTISVQMHFNEICMKIRNTAITMLVGAIGLAAYSTKEMMEVEVFGFRVQIGALIAIVGLVGWAAFWSMDRHWYHMFLRAAGVHAGSIETRWRKRLPELLLSSQITETSRRYLFKKRKKHLILKKWKEEGIKFDSGRRLDTFYAIGGLVLLITAFVIAYGHVESVDKPELAPAAAAPSAASVPATPPVASPSLPTNTTPAAPVVQEPPKEPPQVQMPRPPAEGPSETKPKGRGTTTS
jgi:hypothetical protein